MTVQKNALLEKLEQDTELATTVQEAFDAFLSALNDASSVGMNIDFNFSESEVRSMSRHAPIKTYTGNLTVYRKVPTHAR